MNVIFMKLKTINTSKKVSAIFRIFWVTVTTVSCLFPAYTLLSGLGLLLYGFIIVLAYLMFIVVEIDDSRNNYVSRSQPTNTWWFILTGLFLLLILLSLITGEDSSIYQFLASVPVWTLKVLSFAAW